MQWPPRPGPGLEAHEPERLRRGGVDDLPEVDLHPLAELGELVDERDVHGAEDVLEQLRQLGRLRRGDPVHGVDGGAVELGGALGAGLGDPADDLGHVLRRPVGAAGIDALGREREVEVRADLQAGCLETGQHLLPGRARVGRRLEHDEVARAAGARDLLGRRVQDREVGLALLRERRRQRDQDRVGVAQLVVVGRRAQPLAVDEPLQRPRRERPRCSSRRGSACATRSASRSTSSTDAARLGEHLGERHADVAGPDNGNVGHRRGIVQRTPAAAATIPRRGPLAQLVEQGTLNPKVEGSNPSRPILLAQDRESTSVDSRSREDP